MIVVWGTPESLSGCQKQEDLKDLNKCMDNCLKTEDCVTAVIDESENCWKCNFEKGVTNVKQTTEVEKVKIGFKVKVDITLENCPKGDNPPTFGGLQAEGDASTTTDDGKIQNYTISYTGSGWEFDKFDGLFINCFSPQHTFFPEKARCRGGFGYYKRANTDWCMCIGYATQSNVTYSRASGICAQHGPNVILSGVASAEEVEGLVYQLGKRRETTGQDYFNAMADGQRTLECQQTPKTTKCMSIEGFITVDKTIENFDAYKFMTDSSAGAAEGKQCMVMIGNDENDGKMDFQPCESNFDYSIRGVICGHEAYA